jgi:hypothetical protein
MTPDQLNTLLEAARKTIAARHDLFDYFSLFTPIIAAALGWMAAYWQFRSSFKKGLEKEHYYASKQNVLDIIRLDGNFLHYLYDFYKDVKNQFSNMKPLPTDFLGDFITNYNSQLATIHLMRRIEFPESTFDDKPLMDLLNQLESHISRMDQIIANRFQAKRPGTTEQTMQAPITEEDAAKFTQESMRLIKAITIELSLQDNIMVKILSNEAKRLGISTIMPQIQRNLLST